MRPELHLGLGYRKYDAPSQVYVLRQLARKWTVLLITWKSNWQSDKKVIHAQLKFNLHLIGLIEGSERFG
jgi:hypothetical protein